MYAGRPKAASPSPIRETPGPPAPSTAVGMAIRWSPTMATTVPVAYTRDDAVPAQPGADRPGRRRAIACSAVGLRAGEHGVDGDGVVERRHAQRAVCQAEVSPVDRDLGVQPDLACG